MLSLPRMNSKFDVVTTLGSNMEPGSLFQNFRPIKKASSKRMSTENIEPGKECPEQNENDSKILKMEGKDKTIRMGIRSS